MPHSKNIGKRILSFLVLLFPVAGWKRLENHQPKGFQLVTLSNTVYKNFVVLLYFALLSIRTVTVLEP